MPASEPVSPIRARFEQHGIALPSDQIASFETYLGLLTKWNKTVNLTSLGLSPLADEAIDRLLIEPVLAARFISATEGLLLDVGSGSGSPAIPLKIARPDLDLLMVESRGRKSAFLREAVRQLGFERAEVQAVRLEQLVLEARFHGVASWVSVRAVRADRGLWQAISGFLAPHGRVLWFRSQVDGPEPPDAGYLSMFELEAVQPLIVAERSELAILRRRRGDSAS